MVDRISTTSVFSNTISNFGTVQSSIADLTRQISSGRAAADFKELGSQTRLIQDLESQLSRTGGYLNTNELVNIRLNRMNTSLADLEELATEYRNNLLTERSAAGDTLPLVELSRNLLAQVKDALNVSVEGRFLFAGSRTDTAPVGDIVNIPNIVNPQGVAIQPDSEQTGVPAANYYNGDTQTLQVRASDQLTIDYGITGDETAFQELIGALHQGIRAETQDNEDELEKALNLVNSALDGVVALRNAVNNDIVALNRTNVLHEDFETYLNQTLGDQIGVDVAEASIKLSLDQTILQATFQSFARISSLKLTDFLR